MSSTDKIITIGRSYGAGGRTIGRKIAELFGIPYYDSEILAETAKSSGLTEKYLASVDEKEINDAALYMSIGYMNPGYTSVRQIAANAQREVIEKIASEGPCVIVGRRANEILKDRYNVVSIFIAASEDSRVKHVMAREGLDEKSARKKVIRADKERKAYYNQFGGTPWGYAESYDLCINTDEVPEDAAIRLIECLAGRS